MTGLNFVLRATGTCGTGRFGSKLNVFRAIGIVPAIEEPQDGLSQSQSQCS